MGAAFQAEALLSSALYVLSMLSTEGHTVVVLNGETYGPPRCREGRGGTSQLGRDSGGKEPQSPPGPGWPEGFLNGGHC